MLTGHCVGQRHCDGLFVLFCQEISSRFLSFISFLWAAAASLGLESAGSLGRVGTGGLVCLLYKHREADR